MGRHGNLHTTIYVVCKLQENDEEEEEKEEEGGGGGGGGLWTG